jgi:hypothetical protein
MGTIVAVLAISVAPAGAAGLAVRAVPAGAVSGPSVALSTAAARAGKVAYTVGFTTSSGGALASGSGTVTLSGPTGTVFNGADATYLFDDRTSGMTGTTYGFGGTVGQSGAAITVPTPIAIAAGDRVTITAPGVTNATSTGPHQLGISTSSDTTPVTAGFTLSAPAPVNSVSVHLSTTAAGATQVRYTVSFTASATGALVPGANADSASGITLSGPAGTVFFNRLTNYEADYEVHDLTSGVTGTSYGSDDPVSNGGATITLRVPIAIAAGDQVTVTAPLVGNAAAGSLALTVRTSSDITPAPAPFTLVAPSAPGALTVRLSSTAAGATHVSYTAEFTASATGGLVGDPFAQYSGDVILSAAAGTVFDHGVAADYRFDDLTSGATGTYFGIVGTVSRGGATIAMPVPIPFAAGDKVRVTATGVANSPDAGSQTLTVRTTSDTTPADVGYRLSPPSPVRGLTVSPSHPQAGALAQYTIGFATSATGNLAQYGEITVTGPAGTVFPASRADYCILTSGAAYCAALFAVTRPTGNQAQVIIGLLDAIPAGAPVTLIITGARNSSAAGSRALIVSTSSDTVPATAALPLIWWPGTAVTGTISYQGSPQPGVQVLACPADGTPGECEADVTDNNGAFYEPTGYGAYAITATPAENPTGAQATTVGVAVSSAQPVVTQDITLPRPAGLPAGTTFTVSGRTETAGQVPTLVWSVSSTFTTAGPPDGVGVAVVTATNPKTGADVSVLAPMTESPPGSGKYTATIPPMYPAHGAAAIKAIILPIASARPAPTDFTGGPHSGGTRLLARVSGSVRQILFGGKPGTQLQQVAPGLWSVVAPAGAGKVPMTAVTAAGKTGLGEWTYLPPIDLSTTSGPGDGGGTITLSGSDLGPDPWVLFGGEPSRDVTRTGPDTYTVSVPPGEGTVPVTVIYPGVGVTHAGEYTRTTVPAVLSALLENYYEGAEPLLIFAHVMEAADLEPGGFAGLAEHFAEVLIHAATGYKFTEGPTGALVKAFGEELLLEGPGGWFEYMLARVAASEIDKALYASFSALIDPSGAVVDLSGRPVRAALATLQAPIGPRRVFEAVPASSAGISPHTNPETTGPDGRFDWNAAAGTYRVHAVSATCRTSHRQPASANSATFRLPPPATGLVIILPCQLGRPARPRVGALSPSVLPAGGGPVLVTGTGIGAATHVTVGRRAVPFAVLDAGTLQITAPPGSGAPSVVVTTASGASTSRPGAATLRYIPIFVPPGTGEGHLYWTNIGGGTIKQANRDGSGKATLVTAQTQPFGVAADGSHIYWANFSAGAIMDANLNGTGVTTLVTGQSYPFGVAVDGSHIYWANQGAGTINDANLDGTGVTTLVTGQSGAAGVAVDQSHIYWADNSSGAIMDANLDGTGVTTLVTGQNQPNYLTVDSSHIYWTLGRTIMRANLDGTGVTTLLTRQDFPVGVAVDSSHIYWANHASGTIMDANLDGTGGTTLVTGQDAAAGVALGPQ